MKIRLLIISLIYPFLFVYSQVIVQDEGQVLSATNFGFIKSDHLPTSYLNSSNRTLNYSEIKGSPYIDNQQDLKFDKTIGDLYSPDFKFINTVFIRYNAYTDNMELSLIDDGVDYYHLKKQVDSWFVLLGKHKYRIYNYQLDGVYELGFLKIIIEPNKSDVGLLKKEKVLFKDAINKKDGFLSASLPEFVPGKNYYMLQFNQLIVKVPRKEKDFYSLFENGEERLMPFIKENRYKIFKEEDLIKIISYYNSLK